jgi:hypothetical protein
MLISGGSSDVEGLAGESEGLCVEVFCRSNATLVVDGKHHNVTCV